ncbi:hypothetical protein [Bacillus gobiensis]|uniref:Uncharacterized protein n=1 Tax=Bacillus gobiensis TaxID=1441095 RepID=A0A0M4FE87_9BACI|nr:hypothetical protein [Bacillus gobiensis]ALC80437.1 hypothetical protein AM592_01680 [Bacillus gobiensis]
MIYIEKLISSLQEWNKKVGEERITPLSGLVSLALLQLGSEEYKAEDYQNNPLSTLKKRIEYLQRNESIFEEFLVNGIIFLIKNYFNDLIVKREEHIYNNESLLERINKNELEISSNFVEDTKRKVQFLKSEEYVRFSKIEFDTWNEIISVNFSPSELEVMDREMALEAHRRHEEQMNPEEKRVFQDIINKMK